MNFDATVGHEFEWTQPEALRRLYELSFNGREVATLSFDKGFGSLATGEFGEGKWTFKRAGFLCPRVSVREAGSDADIGIFTPTWTGSGWLTLSSGRRYHLRHTNFWATEWAFEIEDGTTAITLAGPHGLFKHGGYARVSQSVAAQPETPIMVLLIWYLRLLMNQDAGVVAAIAVPG